MMAGRLPFPALLALLAVGAFGAWLPAPWNVWLPPGVALVALGVCLAGGPPPPRIWLAGAAILGWIAVCAVNPTHRQTVKGLLPVAHVRLLPGSADAAGSLETLVLAVGMFAVFALAWSFVPRQIRALQMAALAAGGTMALAVLYQRLGPDATRIREYTGIFVNENHFAVFSNLLLPVVLGMAFRARFRAVQEGRPTSPAGIFLLVALVMAAAVVACRSRAGVAVLALLVAGHVGLYRRIVRDYPFVGVPAPAPTRTFAWASVAAALAVAARVFWSEGRQLAALGREWAFRSGILADALAAWRERPVRGTGPGTFPAVFPYYQSAPLEGRTILHAHCEPVQFLLEFGLAGAVWIAAAMGLALSAKKIRQATPAEIPPFADLERRAFGFALVACALHGLVDFPLRIPLLALIAAAWAGVWAAARPVPEGDAGSASGRRVDA